MLGLKIAVVLILLRTTVSLRENQKITFIVILFLSMLLKKASTFFQNNKKKSYQKINIQIFIYLNS